MGNPEDQLLAVADGWLDQPLAKDVSDSLHLRSICAASSHFASGVCLATPLNGATFKGPFSAGINDKIQSTSSIVYHAHLDEICLFVRSKANGNSLNFTKKCQPC